MKDRLTGGAPGVSIDRLLAGLLALAIAGAILQITLGGVVRVTGSGLGCPDWPLCHGRVIPAFDYHTLLEWSHRTTGAAVGLVFIAAMARAWLRHRENRVVVVSAAAGLGLIVIVGGLGGAVVLTELDPALRTVHLGLAELVVLAMVVAYAAVVMGHGGSRAPRGAGTVESSPSQVSLRWLAGGAAAAALIALLSGSYAVWRGAGAVCPEWPLCGGSLLPSHELIWIHVAHRLTAVLSTVLALWTAFRAWRLDGASTAVRLTAAGAFALAGLQVLAGAANPWTQFEEWARAVHLSLATLVWTDLTLLTAFLTFRPTALPGATTQAGRGPAA
ncbi:MAG: COX15/CtaA family protein [Dehalococcoidia bacterium]